MVERTEIAVSSDGFSFSDTVDTVSPHETLSIMKIGADARRQPASPDARSGAVRAHCTEERTILQDRKEGAPTGTGTGAGTRKGTRTARMKGGGRESPHETLSIMKIGADARRQPASPDARSGAVRARCTKERTILQDRKEGAPTGTGTGAETRKGARTARMKGGGERTLKTHLIKIEEAGWKTLDKKWPRVTTSSSRERLCLREHVVS